MQFNFNNYSKFQQIYNNKSAGNLIIIRLIILWFGVLVASCALAQQVTLANSPNIFEPRFDPNNINNPNQQNIRNFIDETSAQLQIPATEIEKIFVRAKYQSRAVELLTPKNLGGKVGKRNWTKYRTRFINSQRVSSGGEFFAKHRKTLMRAEEQYGVPAEIIAAILNVESRYGENMGNFNSRDVLVTLGFYHPTRAEFFRGELAALIKLSKKWDLNLDSFYGSFAGALGMPQFIPTSIINFAVDFDGDNHLFLEGANDAIGSVANYLAQHGWVKELSLESMVTVISANSFTDKNISTAEIDKIAKKLLEKGVKPSIMQEDLREFGFSENYLNLLNYPQTLVDMPLAGDEIEYRLGDVNFYAITRYNRSFDYASAILELALELSKYR